MEEINKLDSLLFRVESFLTDLPVEEIITLYTVLVVPIPRLYPCFSIYFH